MFKQSLFVAAWLGFGCVASQSASAGVTIFSDNFNRTASNSAGNGWSETEPQADDVAIVANLGRGGTGDNALRLRDNPESNPASTKALQAAIDATGYENLVLSFYWRILSAEDDAADKLFAEFRVGTTGAFTKVADIALGSDSTAYAFSGYLALGPSANGANPLQLEFRISTNDGNAEGVYLDDVLLTGDKAVVSSNSTPAPEPTSICAWGILAVAYAAFRRRSVA